MKNKTVLMTLAISLILVLTLSNVSAGLFAKLTGHPIFDIKKNTNHNQENYLIKDTETNVPQNQEDTSSWIERIFTKPQEKSGYNGILADKALEEGKNKRIFAGYEVQYDNEGNLIYELKNSKTELTLGENYSIEENNGKIIINPPTPERKKRYTNCVCQGYNTDFSKGAFQPTNLITECKSKFEQSINSMGKTLDISTCQNRNQEKVDAGVEAPSCPTKCEFLILEEYSTGDEIIIG